MENKKQEAPKSDKPRKVKLVSIQCHQGITLKPGAAGMVVNGVNASNAALNVELELHPAGVMIIYKDNKGKGKLVPYANITQGDLEFEE